MNTIDNLMITLVQTPEQYRLAMHAIKHSKFVGFDTEGTGLDSHSNKILLAQFYIPDLHTAFVIDCTRIEDYEPIKEILEHKKILKIGHNLSYDWKVSYAGFKSTMEYMHDTMIADRMLYAGLMYKHDLRAVVLRELGIEVDKEIRTSFVDFEAGTSFSPEQITYAGRDAFLVYALYLKQMPLVVELHLERIYELEMNIIAPTALMEHTGITVNMKMLEDMTPAFERFVRQADKALQEMFLRAGVVTEIYADRYGFSVCNTSSPEQVLELMQKVGIDPKDSRGKSCLDSKIVQRWDMQQYAKKAKSRKRMEEINYSEYIEDEDVADALDNYHGLYNPYLRAYAFLQGARKLLATYIEGIQRAKNPITGKVHAYFNSLGAERTGRFSSNRPNLQNIPNDKKLDRLGLGQYSIRKCIEASKGRILIISDYSGIELVILATLSGDKKLMEQIFEGDVHTMVAREVLGYKEINKDNKKKEPHKLWRDGAKTLSYAIAYGTTGRNLSETLNISLASQGYKITPEDGDKLIEAWYALFPDTAAYLQNNANHAIMHGYVMDTWGRRRNWNRETFLNKWKKLAAMREGMNAPIQGTSATMVKRAIWLLWERLDRKRARVIITVHDEIVVESILSYSETAKAIVKECMERAIAETLPLIAEFIGLYEGTSVSPSFSDRYDK